IVDIPRVNIDEKLTKVDSYLIEGKTHAPKRFGEGRLVKKLEDSKIARPSTLANIVPSLLEKKCIEVKGKVIHITNLGRKVDTWLSEYAPWMNDIDGAPQFEEDLEKLEMEDNEEVIESFAFRYNEKIEDLKKVIDYNEEDALKPSEAQIELAKDVAKSLNIRVPDDVLNDKYKISEFLSKHIKKRDSRESLGKCPACKTGKIVKNQRAFGCTNWKEKDCKFSIWIENSINWFKRFDKDVNEEYVADLIQAFCNNEAFMCRNMRKTNLETFDALLTIKKHPQYGWGIAFDKNRKIETANDRLIKQQEEIKKLQMQREELLNAKKQFQSELDDKTEALKKANKEKNTDALTGVYNRQMMEALLPKRFEENEHIRCDFHMIFIDGDRFKGINDNFGHQAGDDVLRYIAYKTNQYAEQINGIAFRYGGEEFLIAAVESNTDKVIAVINNLRKDICSEQVPCDEKMISVSISAGISRYEDGDSLKALIDRADKAVYVSKEKGRNQVTLLQSKDMKDDINE
ncbi:MAG: diguanylate cyclase, partial [Halarcobacter sp.]